METLQSAGLLAGARFELIEGEVYDKMGQNPHHIFYVGQLAALLIAIFGALRVRIQAAVEAAPDEADRSLPEARRGGHA